MKRNKRGGKRLLKNVHSKREYLRRGLSLLLSLCMVVPLITGTISFSALARESAPKTAETKLPEATPAAETREEIKARLMRQIREEGWDPYSADMTLDEFYALMELFQEGSLPLEKDMPEEASSDKVAGTHKITTVSKPDTPEIDAPETDASETDTPETDTPETDASESDTPETNSSSTDASDSGDIIFGGLSDEGPTQETPVTETSKTEASKPKTSRSSVAKTAAAGTSETYSGEIVYVPRTMIMFDGVKTDALPGTDAKKNEYGSPQEYDNTQSYEPYGEEEDETYHYPAGLDHYSQGYTRPPEKWSGIGVDSKLEAVVIVPGTNDGDVSVAGNVDQSLFLTYEGVYVRRVSVQNNDVNVLGAIKLPGTGDYIYYYTNDEKQSTEVSATTLPEGEKFIVHYAHREYPISYTIRFRDADDTFESWKKSNSDSFLEWQEKNPEEEEPDLADWVRTLEQPKTDTEMKYYTDLIFGTDFPDKTDMGAYAFNATAPDGYTLSFYLSTVQKDTNGDGELTWTDAQAALVTYEENEGKPGFYDGVNQGWALGMEPVYEKEGTRLMPNIKKGPQELVTTGTFYNNNVDGERIVAAVLTKKPTPVFNAHSYITSGIAQVSGRGTCGPRFVKGYLREDADKEEKEVVTIPYDYEDVYRFKRGEESKYIYTQLYTSASDKNIQDGNLATVDSWGWNSSINGKGSKDEETIAKSSTIGEMELDEENNTYYFQWTFQTNDGDNQVLDVLEFNRVGITIPYYAKNSVTSADVRGEYPARSDGGGIYSWWAETELPDGAVVKVELLMLFASKPQRIYRITVTGARNDVTITAMNLMQYGQGAQEISAYHLDGITGATTEGTNVRRTAVQFYEKDAKDKIPGWTDNITKGNIYVDSIDYSKGDEDYGGANVRFKLAEGYSNPYFLLESLREGTIEGQASVTRKPDGSVERGDQHPVVPFISDGDDPYMKYYDAERDGVIPGVKEGDPIPVSSEGEVLYYYDSNGNFRPFTDWTTLRVQVDAVSSATWEEEEETEPTPEEGLRRAALLAEEDGDGKEKNEEQVPSDSAQERMVPRLYRSDGTPLSKSQVIAPNKANTFKWDTGEKMKSQYIYSGSGDWYYIRLTTQLDYKIALLTIVAHPSLYVIRYKPQELEEIRDSEGELVVGAHMPENMPQFQHSASCPTFLQGDDETKPHEQFDDNSGFFYDVEVYNTAPVTLTRPTDPSGYYQFVDWVLVDEDDVPIRRYVVRDGNWVRDPDDPGTDKHPNYLTQDFHFTSGSIDIRDLSEVAILNDDLGTTANDIYVLRLMPTWERVEHPFHYTVALNWVDAMGELHAEYFDGLWQDVLTNYEPDDKGLTVKVLTESTPFKDWIAQHPTYTFWDEVNNVMDGEDYDPEDPRHQNPEKGNYFELPQTAWNMEEKIRSYLILYFPALDPNADAEEKAAWQKKYDDALAAMLRMDRRDSADGDDFQRQGNYTYTVLEDNGTIALWMYEDKGGLMFHNDVDSEPYIHNDEFYFTVNQVTVGNNDTPLNGEYKAYPEKAYDSLTGKERPVKDSDAWRVLFTNGQLTNIVKNDGSNWPSKPVTYFTLRDNEGIKLFVPEGRFTVSELGSKSGGSYRVEVNYIDENGDMKPHDEWSLPEGTLWLRGKQKEYKGQGDVTNPDSIVFPDGVSQVSATVQFVIGEANVVSILTFSNQTSALSFETEVIGPYGGEQFGFEATVILPTGMAPLLYDVNGNGICDAANEYFYFNFNLYDVKYNTAEGEEPAVKPDEPPNPGAEPAGRPEKPSTPEPQQPTDTTDQEVYDEWRRAHRAWEKALEDWEAAVEKWVKGDEYQAWLKAYKTWEAWHTWRPGGTVTPANTGRMVVTESTQIKNNWISQYLMIPRDYDAEGNPTSWRRLSSANGVWMKEGQRFSVVCTVPDVGDINYRVEEIDTRGYRVAGESLRSGLVKPAELAYQLFINSRLEGLPATGGFGVKVFQVSGAVFLLSGLGLAWLNKDIWRKRLRRIVG